MAKEKDVKGYTEAKGPKHGHASNKVHHLHIEEGANKGFVVEHHFDNSGMGQYKQPEVNPFGSGEEMLKHVADHYGIKQGEEPDADDKAA